MWHNLKNNRLLSKFIFDYVRIFSNLALKTFRKNVLMKVIILILCSLFHHYVNASLSIEGTYLGKNLYIQNPENEEGFGFCVTKVTVNGDLLPSGYSANAFEIDFSLFNIVIGEPLFIVIEHNSGCIPKILNPEVLLPESTFEIAEISVSPTGKLSWTSINENGKLPFFIEQFRWNKWVQVGEIRGKGTVAANKYEFQTVPHSGQNILRVVQIDHSGNKRKSEETKFTSNQKVISKGSTIVKSNIVFTEENQPSTTRFEIFDVYGNIIKKGTGSTVDCTNLLKGAYYINYDNKTEKFFKN
jgi:hypothetical protein